MRRLARRVLIARAVGVAVLAGLLSFVGALVLPFVGDAQSVLSGAAARLTDVAHGLLP